MKKILNNKLKLVIGIGLAVLFVVLAFNITASPPPGKGKKQQGVYTNIKTISGTYYVTSNDHTLILNYEPPGVFSVIVPHPSESEGQILQLKAIDIGFGRVTVRTVDFDVVMWDEDLFFEFSLTQHDSLTIQSDGNYWYVIEKYEYV
jgi:hypothetical protein